MKRQKYTVKVTPRRTRARWLIHPRTRVHEEPGYTRAKLKREERRVVEGELEREEPEERKPERRGA